METNRTSSFPAETTNKGGLTRFNYQALLGFAFAILGMAYISHWVYVEKSVGFGLFLAFCTAGEALTMLLYYLAAKRGNQPTAGT